MAETAKVTPLNGATHDDSGAKSKVERSGTKFPAYSLGDSIAVARAIHERGGGSAGHDHLAVYLDYKSPKNGAYITRVSAARMFGLVTGQGTLQLTPLAQTIQMPQFAEDAQRALVDAFFSVPLYKTIYEQFRGQEMPPEFGMKNALRLTYKIVPGRIDIAYKAFLDSAETAGFFNTRGSRTQLIIPAIGAASGAPPATRPQSQTGGNGTGSGGAGGEGIPPEKPPVQPPSASTYDELKVQYVSTLINMMKEGTDINKDASEKIERLLGLMEPTPKSA